jgi:hypothetical protein
LPIIFSLDCILPFESSQRSCLRLPMIITLLPLVTVLGIAQQFFPMFLHQ